MPKSTKKFENNRRKFISFKKKRITKIVSIRVFDSDEIHFALIMDFYTCGINQITIPFVNFYQNKKHSIDLFLIKRNNETE